MEDLIKQHRDQWDLLTQELMHLREEAAAGRKTTVKGLNREQSTFYEHLLNLTFGGPATPPEKAEAMKHLTSVIVECLQETIGIIDFWNNPAEQHRLRGEISDALLRTWTT
jgi:type I restriction enzyme R subunit